MHDYGQKCASDGSQEVGFLGQMVWAECWFSGHIGTEDSGWLKKECHQPAQRTAWQTPREYVRECDSSCLLWSQRRTARSHAEICDQLQLTPLMPSSHPHTPAFTRTCPLLVTGITTSVSPQPWRERISLKTFFNSLVSDEIVAVFRIYTISWLETSLKRSCFWDRILAEAGQL